MLFDGRLTLSAVELLRDGDAMSAQRPAQVLFVCTGNTCRSPLAEAVARAHVAAATHVLVARSAGVSAAPGAPASADAHEAAAEVGLDLSAHRSRELTRAMLLESDLILTMSESHAQLARVLAPEKVARIHRLGDYAGAANGEVPDPYGGGRAVYRETLKVLQDLVSRSIDRFVEGAKSHER